MGKAILHMQPFSDDATELGAAVRSTVPRLLLQQPVLADTTQSSGQSYGGMCALLQATWAMNMHSTLLLPL